MRRELALLLIVTFLTGALSVGPRIEIAKAVGPVYIRTDGSIDPPDAPIQRNGLIYTLTGNITSNADGIIIETDNIAVDGAGYSLLGAGSSRGIDLSGRSDVTIRNTEARAFEWGVYLSGSSNNTIASNRIADNEYGIWLSWSSSNNSIAENDMRANERFGVYLFGSSNNNSVVGNTFTDDGLFVSASYNNTVKENVVNGKPLAYLENVSDHTVDDAGQVILVNCDNMGIESLNLSNTSVGLELWGTNNSRIANNNIAGDWDGVYSSYSLNNSIVGSNITGNGEYGVWLDASSNSSVTGNNITENKVCGIHVSFSSNNSIVGNSVTENSFGGVGVDSLSSNNSVSGNNITANHYAGVRLADSSNCNGVVGNNLTKNDVGVVLDESLNNSVIGNNFDGDGLLVTNSYQNTVENNTVNGKPLAYLEGRSDCTVSSAGQVILVNCNSIHVENLDLSNTAVGLESLGTNNSKIINNTVLGNEIAANYQSGIWLFHSSNNSLVRNSIAKKWYGIYLDASPNNSIVGNTLARNIEGIALDTASNYNTVSENNVTSNERGVGLGNSQCNSIVGNSISEKNGNGVYLSASSNNCICGNTVSENSESGIIVVGGSYNNIFENNVADNKRYGVDIYGSNWNSIAGNSLANNTSGISLAFTTPSRPQDYGYNTITGNNITANREAGIKVEHSSHNLICHNNFVDNTNQAVSDGSVNVWENPNVLPLEGNYWSNYVGVDLNRDGVGDTPNLIDASNADDHPLMGILHSYQTAWLEPDLAVALISNSSISALNVVVAIENLQNRALFFYASGESGFGFCRVCIPHVLMDVSNISVMIDGGLTPVLYSNYTLYDNGTHRWIYFAYEHSTHLVVIVPELPSFAFVPILLLATLSVTLASRKKEMPSGAYE